MQEQSCARCESFLWWSGVQLFHFVYNDELTYSGKPRPRNKALETSMPALPPVSSVAERGTAPSPSIDILESFQPARDSPDTSVDASKNVAESHAVSPAKVPVKEASEIEALCMAQRARTPVAVALASDWSDSPFRVPRRFIVLGWFWVADAWVSVV